MTIATKTRQSLRLKGKSFLALVLAPEPPLAGWFRELDNLISGSLGFFVARPVILDVSKAISDKAGLRQLLDELAARGVRVMGVEGVRPALLDPDMPPLVNGGRPAEDVDVPPDEPAAVAVPEIRTAMVTPPPPPPPQVVELGVMLIDRPVRSGESIVFQGDVTVVGAVASGAEIVASGSIHVYGPLRGRAIAGWNGNQRARIFCRRMEAELIAINGLYQTAEDMPAAMRGRPLQAWLDGDSIRLAELN
ncbi:MAG: septum site-determining protein MinC [Bauldia sp.]